MRLTTTLALAAALAGCGAKDGDGSVNVQLGEAVDPFGEGRVDLEVEAPAVVHVFLGGQARVVEAEVGTFWVRPRPVFEEPLDLNVTGEGTVTVTIWARGEPTPPVRRERSLFWTEPLLLDDPSLVGLGKVMAAAAEDGHGGVMLDAWFRRFATTAHSERAGPAQLADEIALAQGPDPSVWDLDLLPFVVTGVHNRIDLAGRSGGCGELRVSLASVHPIYAPFHLIFLFRQVPEEDDVALGTLVHCLGTARRWARLSNLDGGDFVSAAAAFLDERLTHDRFLIAESVELTVSPWEWRQWAPVGGDALDNPPLFQTVDTETLNAPGPLRDDFLGWVADNAALLDARQIEVPERFRAPSARVAQGVPRTQLSLAGLAPAVSAAYPDLRDRIEIIGCPTCHTDDAEFVQTSVQRTVSPFYDRELNARRDRLGLMSAGGEVSLPPFGPLQPLP